MYTAKYTFSNTTRTLRDPLSKGIKTNTNRWCACSDVHHHQNSKQKSEAHILELFTNYVHTVHSVYIYIYRERYHMYVGSAKSV